MNKKKQLKFKTIRELVVDLTKYHFILFLFFILSSCKQDQCSNIGGTWSIEEMRVNNKDFLPYLYLNTFGFHCKDNSAWFQASHFFEDDKTAKWKINVQKGSIESISIKSKIKIYNDNFKVELKKNETTKQFHLILISKNVYISAYKIIDDY